MPVSRSRGARAARKRKRHLQREHVQFRVTSWLRRKRLDEQAFLLRQVEIVAALTLLSPADVEQPGNPRAEGADRP